MGVQVESGYSPFAILGFVVFEDGCVFGALLLVLMLAARLPWVSRGLAVALLLVYAADVFLVHALFSRLTVTHLLQYAGEIRFLRAFVSPVSALVLLALLLALWAVRGRRIATVARGPLAAASVVLVVAPWAVAAAKVTDPYLELTLPNVVRLNGESVVRRGVSDRTFERAKELYPELWTRMVTRAAPSRPFVNRGGGEGAARPNLILLVSESLSRVDSRRSGGSYDRLPRLDAVAARGATFTGLVSDGNNTTQALAALLAAEEPFPTPIVSGSMQSHYPVEANVRHRAFQSSLVEQAQARGYTTAFLSNAPLGFQGNGDWLRRLGFDRVEGGDAPFYEPFPRYSFNAAPDEALFARARDLLASERRRPLFLVLLSVSLHGPYRTPEATGGDSPLLSALRYVDRTTAGFYETLKRAGYFESGHLLIVGDHRRMTPLEPRERRDLGVDSLGCVFGCLVGPGIPSGSLVRAPLNQSDLYELAEDLMDGPLDTARGFERYNKGVRYRLGALLTTHLLSGDRGLVRIRPAGSSPYTARIAASEDPVAAAPGALERRIAAYVVLRTGLLEQRQEAARR